MSTCNRLDLQTLGSQPVVMPKILPDQWQVYLFHFQNVDNNNDDKNNKRNNKRIFGREVYHYKLCHLRILKETSHINLSF